MKAELGNKSMLYAQEQLNNPNKIQIPRSIKPETLVCKHNKLVDTNKIPQAMYGTS